MAYKRTDFEGRTIIGLDGAPTYLRPLENVLGDIVFPELMRNTRIPRVELHQLTPCHHALNIRDRTLDGGTSREYWFQTSGEHHACAAKDLPSVAAAILREHYTNIGIREDVERHVWWPIDAITLPKQGVRIADLTTLLIRELPPYLNVQTASIVNYARSDDRPAEIVDVTGRHSHWYL